jgi:hypothetical protein
MVRRALSMNPTDADSRALPYAVALNGVSGGL